jgi:hypothetical protein
MVKLFRRFFVLYIMKKVIAIFIAGILLTSGMQITLDRHYCGGKITGIKLSVTGKMATCGMEEPGYLCSNVPVMDKKCCEDVVNYYSIDNNYVPEYFSITYPITERDIPLAFFNDFTYRKQLDSDLITHVIPPGHLTRSNLTQSAICVFRI